jgi:hypothetical protein
VLTTIFLFRSQARLLFQPITFLVVHLEPVPMRAAALILTFISSWAFPVGSALAWWDEGHMQIAYVAYQQLDPPVKDKVDALLKLNKDYALWIAGAPDADTAKLYAFVHAATWADDIKMKSD